jgi:hypothetical protein
MAEDPEVADTEKSIVLKNTGLRNPLSIEQRKKRVHSLRGLCKDLQKEKRELAAKVRGKRHTNCPCLTFCSILNNDGTS